MQLQRGKRKVTVILKDATQCTKTSGPEYRHEYPYVPPDIMSKVETLRDGCCAEEIWEFRHVPKPHSGPKVFWDKSWSWGRFIFKDRVLMKARESNK